MNKNTGKEVSEIRFT
ncbi:GnsA/GnsB family addiction module toxin, partial [Escherichia sp. SP-MK2]